MKRLNHRWLLAGVGIAPVLLVALAAGPLDPAHASPAPGPDPVPSGVQVQLPPTAASAIRLASADGGSVAIQLPAPAAAAGHSAAGAAPAAAVARAIGAKAVRYENVLADTDSTVEDMGGSVRISMITKSATAPRSFVFPLSLPAGAQLRLLPDGSVVALAPSAAGLTYVAGVKAPFALDAAGKPVATRFQVSGTMLTQTISPGPGAAYPIVSDPWLGKDLIDHASWVYHTEGWTLQVTPTGWQRFWNGYWPASSGWDELYSKYKDRGLNTNLEGMRDQYICHVQIVSVRAPNKPTWNLDEWRPNVGYLQTINSACNPGGPKWFD